MYRVTLWHICITTVAMETQQCVLLSTEYRTLFCLNLLSCPNNVIPFGLER
jgi:hypothetical protein